ncbi:Anaerobic selenocysteine-containing dehydrogenase [Amycolatopsis arida]|uniref:Anaerobic selenocysteine-containing dehydrogenase n=1 Tax=Amycolatopsis arida TaxID=587909 RepID=A0A1I5QC27_9PSEU|nr:molybdopterin-dependent oxidoreductase [Amycolatopsis arida]TDX98781.1 anaerobic selenocysteine-containing dehydrogenase [Amycolatopsis arida]SFP43591.1 Anaerobic selenocysteine-containing dehydrogenase [Amycolatopsis arida]
MRTAYRTCPICDAICGLRLSLDNDGRVTSVQGDAADPLSRGFLCAKGASLGALDADPDRLRVPLVRKGDEWLEVSWEEAFQTVDRGLGAVIDEHGRQALAVYFGNPTYHTMAGFMYRTPLTQSLGSRHVYSAATIDQMPKHVSCGLMFGDPFAVAVPDLDRTDYLLILGANPAVSNGSLCVAPDFPRRLKAIRRRRGKVVVVDPRRTRTADLADEHVFVRPGTDAFLLFGIVHALFAEDLVTVDVEVNGLTELRRLAADFTARAVEKVCGVPAAVISRLARELAAAPSAAVYGRIGTCTVEFGTITQWLVDVIAILTGNFDRPGGLMFAKTAHAEIFRTGVPYTQGNWHSRVRELPETMGELPVATLADEIETPGEGQVHALVTVAGNLALSAPNGPRLAAAFGELDFMVCVDPYLNETTRHADVILPPPRILQTPHYDFLEQTIAVRNYTRFSPAIHPLEPNQLSEAEIMAKLVLILSGYGPDVPPAALDEQVIGAILDAMTRIPGSPLAGRGAAEVRDGLRGDSGPELLLDALLKSGPYGLSLAHLLDKPNGVDLGPLRPRLPELVCTESGRVELAPSALTDDVARLRERLAVPAPEFVLIGRRQLRSNNSWLHNVRPLAGGSNRCTLQVNPADAARLGLGGRALVRSAAGEVEVPVEPSDTIMPGVVSLPHGWGQTEAAQQVASAKGGVNVNALTDESVVDTLSGNAVFNGVPISIRPC